MLSGHLIHGPNSFSDLRVKEFRLLEERYLEFCPFLKRGNLLRSVRSFFHNFCSWRFQLLDRGPCITSGFLALEGPWVVDLFSHYHNCTHIHLYKTSDVHERGPLEDKLSFEVKLGPLKSSICGSSKNAEAQHFLHQKAGGYAVSKPDRGKIHLLEYSK